jgi:hypothetical protein
MTEYKDWVPDEAVEELTLRRALANVEDPVSLAQDLFKEALPLSVMSLTHMAIHSQTENIRYMAAKLVVERVMGAAMQQGRPVDERPAWEKIFDTVLVETDRIVDKPK